MIAVITDKLRNNDSGWFKKFMLGRSKIERFLLDNKSALGIILQNLSRKRRIPAMRELFDFLVKEASGSKKLSPDKIFAHIGISGRIYDLTMNKQGAVFSDDTKSQIFYRKAIESAQVCPLCQGYLDVGKSVSYDHKVPRRDGGRGTVENGQMVHPYCNTGMKG
jgi:HNH endonuclease